MNAIALDKLPNQVPFNCRQTVFNQNISKYFKTILNNKTIDMAFKLKTKDNMNLLDKSGFSKHVNR